MDQDTNLLILQHPNECTSKAFQKKLDDQSIQNPIFKSIIYHLKFTLLTFFKVAKSPKVFRFGSNLTKKGAKSFP